MALDRDIFWVGRQWAVTGFGMQAVDQRLKGAFDIEAARLWDSDLEQHLRDQKWFSAEDFSKGLAAARKHYPGELREVTPPPVPPSAPVVERSLNLIRSETKPTSAPKPAPLVLRAEGCRGKFLKSWRIRIH